MDLEKFEKFNETENYIAYLEKNPLFSNMREIIIYYEVYNRYMRTLLNDNNMKIFFKTADYAKIMGKVR